MARLANIGIRTKLLALVALPVAVLALLAAFDLRSRTLAERKSKTRELVEAASGVLDHFHAQEEAGKLSRADAQASALAELKLLRYSGKEYFWVNDMRPSMIMHPIKPELDGKDLSANADPNGKHLFIEMVKVVREKGGGFVEYEWPKPGADKAQPKVSYVKGFAPWEWVLGSGVYVDDVYATFRHDLLLAAGAIAVLVVVAGLLALVLAGGMVRRLRETAEVLDATADGDFTHELEIDSADEVGQMAVSLNQAVTGMRGALASVRTVSTAVGTSSQELNTVAQGIARAAEEQASSLEETAANIEELTATVRQNADNAQQANQFAASARTSAETGGRVVESAVAAMGEITAASRRIADIITTIDEIAFQTNLLALNAAVEAARAGDQGRGFAVVASEVRNLAQRSATAAKEIKELIADSLAKVENGSTQVNQSGHTLKEIVGAVKRVTDIIGEIAAASREQAAGIEQVSRAVSQMDTLTQANAAEAQELSETATGLSSQADQLQELVARFKLGNAQPGRGVAAARPAPARPSSRHAGNAARRPAPRARSVKPVPALTGGTIARSGGTGASRHAAGEFEEF
ncbi:MAG TPA: methyl-accepting chemotaxis protein [Candidatus Acidoferrum sp.]|nr:methyl-accepting chemotaxis protein [Candidatus Acidoferrum sp.]